MARSSFSRVRYSARSSRPPRAFDQRRCLPLRIAVHKLANKAVQFGGRFRGWGIAALLHLLFVADGDWSGDRLQQLDWSEAAGLVWPRSPFGEPESAAAAYPAFDACLPLPGDALEVIGAVCHSWFSKARAPLVILRFPWLFFGPRLWDSCRGVVSRGGRFSAGLPGPGLGQLARRHLRQKAPVNPVDVDAARPPLAADMAGRDQLGQITLGRAL